MEEVVVENSNIIIKTLISHPEAFLQWLFAIAALIAVIVAVSIKVYKWIEKYRSARNELDKRELLLDEHTADIKKLEQSYDKLDKKIDKLTDTLTDYVEHSKLDSQAMLRDDILHLYRDCKRQEHQYILDQDIQNYLSLYKRYDANHGNGYVHDIVDPYMRSLPTFLSEEQAKDYFEKNK